jgi:hypothetical protein
MTAATRYATTAVVLILLAVSVSARCVLLYLAGLLLLLTA